MVTDVAKPKWDLFVGVQIERLPIISKSLNKLEQDYQVISGIVITRRKTPSN